MPEHINIDVDFDNSIDTTQVINEDIIVSTVTNFKGSRYVYRLKYIPFLGDPAKLPTISGLTKVEGVSPATGEFRIVEQALNLTHPSPHMLEFNSAQAGNSYQVSYWKYAESQDKEKVVYHDVLREVVKSDGIKLSNNTTQIFIEARSYFYFREKIMIEDNQVVETPSLSASTTYYLYCDDFNGTNSYEGIYSTSTTTPAFDSTRLGYYNNDSKAIAKFITNGSSQIYFVESLGYMEPQLNILTLTGTYSLNNYEDYNVIELDGTNGDYSVTLPTGGAVVKGKKLKFKKITASGKVEITGTIDGYTNLSLFANNDILEIYFNGTEWKILGCTLSNDYGYINRSAYTNKDLGHVEIDYDNLTGTYTTGEIVREYSDVPRTIATGKYGVIISDDGTTLKLREVQGGGVFTNNLYLEGDISGATSDVNEPSGSTKNLDSNILHNMGISLAYLTYKFYISEDGTDNTLRTVVSLFAPTVYAGSLGMSFHSISINEVKTETGTGGIGIVDDSQSNNIRQLDSEDFYYKIRLIFHV